MRTRFGGIAAAAMLSALAAVAPCTGAALYTLTKAELRAVQGATTGIELVLTFNTQPATFPIYAMTDPERIVIDLTGTTAAADLPALRPPSGSIIDVIDIARAEIDKEPVVRMSLFVKKPTSYRAYVSGNRVVLSLSPADEVKESRSVFKADTTSSSQCSLRGIEMMSRAREMEIEFTFTSLPGAASIYMLDSPPRIVMDFHDVFVDKAVETNVGLFPVKDVSIVKTRDDPSYTGLVIHLQKSLPFQYRQVGPSIMVTIPTTKKLLSKGRMIMLISAGVIAGGTATGLLLGGEKRTQGGATPAESDLGLPPALPAQ